MNGLPHFLTTDSRIPLWFRFAACTFANEAGVNVCRVCEALKPTITASVGSAPSLPSRLPRSASPTYSRTSAGTVCSVDVYRKCYMKYIHFVYCAYSLRLYR